MSETDLTLEALEKKTFFPRFSSRECTQSLIPLPRDCLRRTINGVLLSIGYEGHRKFISVISCKDKVTPSFEGLWEGIPLKVGCIQSLTQSLPHGPGRIRLERQPISLHVFDHAQKLWDSSLSSDQWLSLPSSFPGGFVTYRPVLNMVVRKYELETDEWGLTVGWKLELEEQ